jgi:hypothetical protein
MFFALTILMRKKAQLCSCIKGSALSFLDSCYGLTASHAAKEAAMALPCSCMTVSKAPLHGVKAKICKDVNQGMPA